MVGTRDTLHIKELSKRFFVGSSPDRTYIVPHLSKVYWIQLPLPIPADTKSFPLDAYDPDGRPDGKHKSRERRQEWNDKNGEYGIEGHGNGRDDTGKDKSEGFLKS